MGCEAIVVVWMEDGGWGSGLGDVLEVEEKGFLTS